MIPVVLVSAVRATLLGLAFLVGMMFGPRRATCPVRWHHNGIGPTGSFSCTRAPVGDPEWDGTWQRPDRSHVPPGYMVGRIYCTGGSHPIVVDDRRVGCQR